MLDATGAGKRYESGSKVPTSTSATRPGQVVGSAPSATFPPNEGCDPLPAATAFPALPSSMPFATVWRASQASRAATFDLRDRLLTLCAQLHKHGICGTGYGATTQPRVLQA